MKANMPFRTQPIRNMKTGKEDTRKRTPRLANVKSYNLDGLVRFALDNNYIEGAKYELAKGIVKGVIEAQRELVRMGNAVSDFPFTCIDEKEELVPPYITSVTCAGHEDDPTPLFEQGTISQELTDG